MIKCSVLCSGIFYSSSFSFSVFFCSLTVDSWEYVSAAHLFAIVWMKRQICVMDYVLWIPFKCTNHHLRKCLWLACVWVPGDMYSIDDIAYRAHIIRHWLFPCLFMAIFLFLFCCAVSNIKAAPVTIDNEQSTKNTKFAKLCHSKFKSNNDSILYGRNNISNTKYKIHHDHGQIQFTFISTWIRSFQEISYQIYLCVWEYFSQWQHSNEICWPFWVASRFRVWVHQVEGGKQWK